MVGSSSGMASSGLDSSGLRWLVLGATGFVGQAVAAELRARNMIVVSLAAPRLLVPRAVADPSTGSTAAHLAELACAAASAPSCDARPPSPIAVAANLSDSSGAQATAVAFARLREEFAGIDVVVNAAGLATPGDGESPALTGANALLPALVALAANAAGVKRFVHLSSASVQGHRRTVDETSSRAPFSAYSRSKALGEEVLELLAEGSVLSAGQDR